MRHEEYTLVKLKECLEEIKKLYGGEISIKIIKTAAKEHPEKFPSYKTFERKFGNIKNIRNQETPIDNLPNV